MIIAQDKPLLEKQQTGTIHQIQEQYNLPQETVQEYIEIINQVETLNDQLSQQIRFYQSELQQMKQELQNMQFENDRQYRESVLVLKSQSVNSSKVEELKRQLSELTEEIKSVRDENEELLQRLTTMDLKD